MVPQVVCHGELLIDFLPSVSKRPLAEVPTFEKAAGGAPGNVAVALARLGQTVGFMGQVGDDPFGHFLADTLSNAGVDISALSFSAQAPTGLAFVSISAKGERDFLFYRSPSADMLYSPHQVPVPYLRSAQLLHVGSISMIREPARAATLRALGVGREHGLTISFDANLRLNLWPNADAARQAIELIWPLANLIKVSEDELAFLTGNQANPRAAARSLWHKDLQALIVTQGDRGCTFFTEAFMGQAQGFDCEAVDTTGAGDGFFAGFIHGLLENPDAVADEDKMRAICRFANAVGALTISRPGAIPALPYAAEVHEFLERNGVASGSSRSGHEDISNQP